MENENKMIFHLENPPIYIDQVVTIDQMFVPFYVMSVCRLQPISRCNSHLKKVQMKGRGQQGGERDRKMARGKEEGRKREREERDSVFLFSFFFLNFKEIESCSGILCSFNRFSQKVPEIYFAGEKLGTSSV